MKSFQEIRNIIDCYSKSSSVTLHEAKLLFRHATGYELNQVDFSKADVCHVERFLELLIRRSNGEPVQYLLGRWPFLDFEVVVDSRALIPRPETELLAMIAGERIKSDPTAVVVDLCAGSGVIAFAIERIGRPAEIHAVEIMNDACSLMEQNRNELKSNIIIHESDAVSYLESLPDQSVTAFVSNPPYVSIEDYTSNYEELRFEPRTAFIADNNGLAFYEAFSPLCFRKLKKSGFVLFEVGDDQADAVKTLLKSDGYSGIESYPDYQGIERVISGYRY